MISKSIKNESILDEQIKDFIISETNHDYGMIMKIEKSLKDRFEGEAVESSITVGGEKMVLESKSTFGAANEHILGSYMSKMDFIDVKPFPNGIMNFPDMTFRDNNSDLFANMDFKAVFSKNYKTKSDMISPFYSSGIGTISTITDICLEYMNTTKATRPIDSLCTSLICMTYYSVDENDAAVIEKIKIVPLMMYIRCREDFSDFASKRKPDKNGNINAKGGLSIKKGSYGAYIYDIKQVLKNKNLI